METYKGEVMFIVGGLFLALALAAAALVYWMIERGGFARVLGFCLLAVPVVLIINWQLPYWMNR